MINRDYCIERQISYNKRQLCGKLGRLIIYKSLREREEDVNE